MNSQLVSDCEIKKAAADEPPSVRRRLGFLMRDSARLMRRRFIQRAREAGLPLNQSEATALAHIAHEPGMRQSLLASRLDIEPIVLVRLLDTLQQAGLIERRTDAGDRRIRTVWLTEAAHPVLEQIHSIGAEVRAEALAGFSQDAKEQLLDSLVALRANLMGQASPFQAEL